MSFIPIIAKSDIVQNGDTATATVKKGKITPAQMAQLNAFTLANKTGILDCLNHCTATASTVGSDNISTVTFQSGYIVVCGRLIECENGTTVEINTLSIPNGKIILSVDLTNLQENEVKIQVVANSYVLQIQDLNENSLTGKYDFELYSYTTSGSTVTLTRTNTNYIPTVNTALTDVETKVNKTILGTGTIGSGSAPLQGYNTDKGTVEERLTALGFKSGAITFCGTDYSPNATTAAAATQGLFRQGNYVVGKLMLTDKKIDLYAYGIRKALGTIPANFRPFKAEYITITGTLGEDFSSTSGSSFGSGTVIMKINTNGIVEYVNTFGDSSIPFYESYKSWLISFGYEAPAIT